MLTSDDKRRVEWITELGIFALKEPKHFDACVLAMQTLAKGGDADPHHLLEASRRLYRRRQQSHACPPARTIFAQ